MEFVSKMLIQLAEIDLTPSKLMTLSHITGYSIDKTTQAFNALTGKELSPEAVSKALSAIKLGDFAKNNTGPFKKESVERPWQVTFLERHGPY